MFTPLRLIAARVRAFVRRDVDDHDFRQEMDTHLAMLEERLMRQGMTPEQARRAARVELGGTTQLLEAHRETRGLPLVDTLLWDCRYALRTFRRDLGFSVFAILIVGLGVGACVTVFSVVNAVWLRPLPFEEPARLVWIANGTSDNLSAQTVQVASLLDLQGQAGSFASMAGFSPFYGVGDVRLTGAGEPERLTGVPVTESFFPLLGVRPQLGRLFTAAECLWNAPKVVILSHDLWRRRFTADPSIVGRAITLNGLPATVVGVLPASFRFAETFAPGSRADLFVPFPLSAETNRRGNTLALLGRLKSGVDLRAAQAESTLIVERMRPHVALGRPRNGFQPRISPLRQRVSGRVTGVLLALAGAVGVLMLLVCANLSNLLLARASARRAEMALRAALGADRRRLIGQTLVESLTLSGCGSLLGLVAAIAGTQALARLQGTTIPLLEDVRVDGVALAFTVLMAVATGIVFGVLPALQVSGLAPHSALRDGGRGSIGAGRGWMRRSIVVAEIVLVCILLTGAGLLVRSLMLVLDVDMGFKSEKVIAVRVDPSRDYRTLERRNAYFDDVLRTVRAIPGVEAAGLTDALPLGDNFGWRTWGAAAKGSAREDGRLEPLVRMVDDDYFTTMQIRLRAGRTFAATDDASGQAVVIVNDTLARALWPGEDPLGRILVSSRKEWLVVGVATDARYFSLDRDSGAEMYMPLRQTGDYEVVDLVVRASGPPARLVPAVRAALKGVDPDLPATQFRTLEQLIDRSVFARRLVVLLLAGFAGFGLILASLGIYGVISYSVSQRRQEIGIRLALGASPRVVEVHFLTETLKLALAGLAVGLPASWIAARAIKGLLFGVASTDSVTFAAVLLLVGGVAALAGYVPARRASRIDPITALRSH